jgi:HEAT repeat protein
MDTMDAPIWKYRDYVERTGHPSVLVRRWAVERLVDLYERRARKAVCELAHDDDVYVATTAIEFIATHSLTNWAFPLLAKFRESEGVIAGSCAVALARLGFDEAVPFFAEKFDSIGNLEIDELVGILRALELIPTLEASRLVLRIAHLFEESTNGVFAAILVRSMLVRNKRDLLEWAVNYFLRRAFGLDDKGARVLTTLMQGAGVGEHVQRVRTKGLYSAETMTADLRRALGPRVSPDSLARLAKAVDHKVGRRVSTALFGGLAEAARAVLVEKNVIPSGEQYDLDSLPNTIRCREMFNFHLLRTLARDRRLMETMDKAQFEQVVLLGVYALVEMAGEMSRPERIEHEGAHPNEVLSLYLHTPSTVLNERDVVASILQNGVIGDVEATCVRVLKDRSSETAMVRAARLLGLLKDPPPVAVLWDSLATDLPDDVCAAAEGALGSIGTAAVRHIARHFDDGDPSQKMYALGVLSRVPTQRSVETVLAHLDEMWEDYADFLVAAMREIASEDFIAPLETRMVANSDAEEAFLTICEVNGVADPSLKAIRKRVARREDAARREGSTLAACNDPCALAGRHCHLRLICRHCALNDANASNPAPLFLSSRQKKE